MSVMIRLVHISDLHLTAEDCAKRSEPKLWGRLVGMNSNFRALISALKNEPPHALLVTGDVTDRGEQRAWEVFWETIEAANLKNKTLVIPGNHDVSVLGVRKRPASEDLARARAGLRQGGQPTSFPWVRLIEGDLALFALDSTNGGNMTGMTNAIGWLGADQLMKLGKSLREYAAVPGKLIMLHHSPNIPGKETACRRGEKPVSFYERASMQLDERDRFALRILARTFQVDAILHGHTHDSPDRRVNSVRMIGCPASTEPVDGNLLYRTYDLFPTTGRLRTALCAVPAPVQLSEYLHKHWRLAERDRSFAGRNRNDPFRD